MGPGSTPCCGTLREYNTNFGYFFQCTTKETFVTTCLGDGEDYTKVCMSQEVTCLDKGAKLALCGARKDLDSYNPKKSTLPKGFVCHGWETTSGGGRYYENVSLVLQILILVALVNILI
jgi:hypothetical protein